MKKTLYTVLVAYVDLLFALNIRKPNCEWSKFDLKKNAFLKISDDLAG